MGKDIKRKKKGLPEGLSNKKPFLVPSCALPALVESFGSKKLLHGRVKVRETHAAKLLCTHLACACYCPCGRLPPLLRLLCLSLQCLCHMDTDLRSACLYNKLLHPALATDEFRPGTQDARIVSW
jgi:hypothetical protein